MTGNWSSGTGTTVPSSNVAIGIGAPSNVDVKHPNHVGGSLLYVDLHLVRQVYLKWH